MPQAKKTDSAPVVVEPLPFPPADANFGAPPPRPPHPADPALDQIDILSSFCVPETAHTLRELVRKVRAFL